ncbi:polyhydroxyalkanoate synthesis repressor PhaR [Corticibacter populi]|uniref:Polyhydroxyalkanoate synthesis repressor PhaR n=1 Tax=Corticibacter populi TaxID=1550736 RepID=A0A3M6R152_9BURK|nr:polyhydroxyalkanoate synthesis repressor PhaR [Corticibacter populi]RMX08462.1 polyhydroxyalkanoate synthesis repressor PhaR [Corticibacter populi]RZS35774.1 polyhydroxyalkanoate synthesis repressor PhaR [Corticibacter populi]
MATRKNADTAAHAGAPQGRVIKKYPNRRLYDLANSCYITLADVKQLVMEHEPVVVVDAKSGEDLTRSILLQIILEEEAAGTPIFTEAVLANLIRFYGHTMQGFMGAYIEKNIQAMAEMQAQWAEQSRQMPPEIWSRFAAFGNPVLPNVMENYTEQSRQALTKMQEQMQDQVRQQTEQFMQLFGLKPKG